MRISCYGQIAILCVAVLTSGCASYGSVDGVDNLWREASVDQFKKGVTTQADVLEQLGPPSQLINLEDQTVFYYLTQQMSGDGQIFIVWNRVRASSKYDRAIFFRFGRCAAGIRVRQRTYRQVEFRASLSPCVLERLGRGCEPSRLRNSRA